MTLTSYERSSFMTCNKLTAPGMGVLSEVSRLPCTRRSFKLDGARSHHGEFTPLKQLSFCELLNFSVTNILIKP